MCHMNDGQIVYRVLRGASRGLRRFAELADAIQKWLGDGGAI